jgi:hypothetical protein
MLDSAVPRSRLEAMPDRVAEIQDPAKITLFLVIHYNVGFYRCTACNQILYSGRIALKKQPVVPLEVLKQFGVSNDPILERFV